MEFLLGVITVLIVVIIAQQLLTKKVTKKIKAIAIVKRVRERGEPDIKLKEKLIFMLGGNGEEAERLIAKKRFGKEGKYSEDYCCWLAIRELEKQNKK